MAGWRSVDDYFAEVEDAAYAPKKREPIDPADLAPEPSRYSVPRSKIVACLECGKDFKSAHRAQVCGTCRYKKIMDR